MRDRRILYATVFLRALSVGLLGVLLYYHLAARGFDELWLGHALSAGLFGTAGATILVGGFADAVGRRRSLVLLSALAALGAVGVALATDPTLLLLAAFFGMVNGAGRDRGALPSIEQAVLAAGVEAKDRTKAFAFYNVAGDAGVAIGALLVWAWKGLAPGAAKAGALAAASGNQVEVGEVLVAALLFAPCVALYASLSRAVEAPPSGPRAPLSPETRRRLVGLSGLFALDSLGGGFVTASLLALFFDKRFGVPPETLALLLFGSRILNAVSHLGAAWLSKRIGLVNTMVFTHIPSSLLLATVAFAPTFSVAAVLYLLREGLVEMDVPTRQSYVMAIVRPEERTRAAAVTNLVRLLGWAVAAEVAGRLAKGTSLWVPLVACAALKIAYDILLYLGFRRVRPPEELP